MKKILISILVLLISLNFVNAVIPPAFATLATDGLRFADPKTAELVSNVICVASPVECLVKKGTNLVNQETLGKLKQEMYSQVQKNLDPKIFEALNTAKQIQGQIGQAGRILNDLKMNENGGIESGSIEVGKENEKKTIKFAGGIKPEYNEETKTTRYTFAESGGKIDIGQGPYTNTYTNIKSPTETTECKAVCFDSRNSYIEVDEKGNIVNAAFETSGPSEFVFGNQWIKVPKNTRVNYDGNQIRLDGQKGEQLKDVGFLNNFDPSKSEDLKKNYPSYNIDYNERIGQVTFTNEGVEIFSGITITDTKLKYSVTNTAELGGSNVFITDNIRNKGSYSNVVIANEAGLSFMGSDYDIKLNQGNPWVEGIVDGKNSLVLKMGKESNSVGSLSNNHLDIGGGKVELISSVDDNFCKSDVTYTATSALVDHGNTKCIYPLTVSSKDYNIINKNGISEVQSCAGTTGVTGGSIFDVLTGRFILWVTGMAGAPCTSYVVSDKTFTSTEKTYDTKMSNNQLQNNEYILVNKPCIDYNVGVHDKENKRCFYNTAILSSIEKNAGEGKAFTTNQFTNLKKDLNGAVIVSLNAPEVTVHTQEQIASLLNPSPPQPSLPPVSKNQPTDCSICKPEDKACLLTCLQR